MNKKIVAVIVSIGMIVLLTSISIADLLSNSDSTVEISKDAKITLATKNITNPQTSPLDCDGKDCVFSMWSGDYKLGTHKIPEKRCDEYSVCEEENYTCEVECLDGYFYTAQELLASKNKMIVNKLEFYADVIEERAGRTSETKLGEGSITISEE